MIDDGTCDGGVGSFVFAGRKGNNEGRETHN
jgi:hypothetical protein